MMHTLICYYARLYVVVITLATSWYYALYPLVLCTLHIIHFKLSGELYILTILLFMKENGPQTLGKRLRRTTDPLTFFQYPRERTTPMKRPQR